MNMTLRNILLVGAVVCILAISGTVAAVTETDSTGDVWHYQETDGGWSWNKYTGDKPNIDITEVTHSFDGSQVTLTLKVDGEIENSEDINYWIHLEGDNSNYIAHYSNEQGMVGGEGAASGFYHMISDPISGDTFTATFEVDNPDDSYNVYGYVSEYTSSEEQWGDYAPNEYADWYSEDEDTDDTDETEDDTTDEEDDGTDTDNKETEEDTSNDGDTSDNGTPGFEIISLFVAVVAVLLVLTKKKKY